MKVFFEYIKDQITARVTKTVQPGGTPAPTPVTQCVFPTIRMWNNQFVHSNGTDSKTTVKTGFKDEKAFAYPACFVEFIVDDVNNLALGIKDYLLTVRFRFGLEGYKFVRLESFDFCDDFTSMIQLMAPSTVSGLTFTTFQEVRTEFDEDHNNVEVPYIDYRVRYRSQVSYQRRNDVIATPDTLVINFNQPVEGLRTINGGGSRIINTGDFRSVVV